MITYLRKLIPFKFSVSSYVLSLLLGTALFANNVYASPISDDFHTGSLNTQLWTVVDPVGDGTVQLVGAGTADAHLLLSVPAGTNHDAWTTNNALRVMQPTADEDFEIEAKFESEPNQKFQIHGLLVEQDADDFVRFSIHSTKNRVKVFAAHLVNGSPTTLVTQTITSSPITYLRLTRAGDQWTAQYSYDGVNWVTATSFSHPITATTAGVFAGNAGPSNPAYTAVVDYFFNTASPIVPEDPPLCNPADQFTLTTSVMGNGTVDRNPDQATYGCGEVVTLTAQPDAGWDFVDWSGDISGSTNPTVVTMEANTTTIATFQSDQSAPVVSNINVSTTETSATVSWDTDEPSTGLVEYGLTASYELGSVASTTLATSHSVDILGLTAGTTYHYRITAEDEFSNSASTTDATFTTSTSGGGGSGIVSDDFHTGSLNTQLWTVVDPVGDGTVQLVGAGTADAHLLLSVPAGTNHDAWTTNNALRVMQPTADEDFEIEAKFESEPNQKFQIHGLLVEQDADDFVRFSIHSTKNRVKVFAAHLVNGSPTTLVTQTITSSPITYLRLTRAGDQWTAQYSYDGVNWVTATSFSHPITATTAGVFAGNAGPSNPAYTAVVDYFFNTASPIVPEDPPLCNPADQFTLTTSVMGNGTVDRNPDQATYGCGEVVTLTAQPDAGWDFVDWSGDISGSTNPTVVTMEANTTTIATFQSDQSAPVVSNINVSTTETSATVSWDTDEPSTGLVEYGLTASYELGSVASTTLATSHSVDILGLTAGTTYHYRITAEDEFSNSASTTDATFTTSTSGGGGSGIVSDDFHTGSLNTQLWTVVDPVGDGTVQLVGAGTADAHLLLSVPAGTNHDAWTTNNALRVMQPTADEDFEIEAKFESEPNQKFQIHGLLVEQDADDFIRFDVYSNGSGPRIFAAHFTNGSPNTLIDQSITPGSANYLRLTRAGSQWTVQYSADASNWVAATSFTRTIAVSSVGVFSGNAGANPAYTAVVDYFFNTASPISPEDPLSCNPADQFTLTTSVMGNGTVDRNPDQATYGCGEVVTLTAQPDAGWDFVDWSGDVVSSVNPIDITMGSNVSATATFQLSGGGGNGPAIDVWYGPHQVFGTAGISQRFVNVLGSVGATPASADLFYSLNGGSETELTLGKQNSRLVSTGDFNVEIDVNDLSPGLNQVALRAVDVATLEETLQFVTVEYIDNVTTPATYSVDWSAVTDVSDVAQIVDGNWSLSSAGVRTLEIGYDRLIAIGDLTWTNYDATVDVTLHSTPDQNKAPILGLAMRWVGHDDDGLQPRLKWWPLGALAGYTWTNSLTGLRIFGSDGLAHETNDSVPPPVAGNNYKLRMRADDTSGGQIEYKFKIWQEGTTEPTAWQISWTTDSVNPPPNGGSLLLVAHHLDVTFGNIAVTPVTSANQSPVASFNMTPSGGDAPLIVDFDASGAFDPDGTIVSYEWDFGDGGSDTTTVSSTTHTFNSAGTFNVALTVTDNQGSTDTIVQPITVTEPLTPPVIVNEPQDTTVSSGQSAVFNVVATGSAPLSYQWEEFDGNNFISLSGETSSSLTIGNVQFPADNGRQFRVIVSNSQGTATSATAVLTVVSAPTAIDDTYFMDEDTTLVVSTGNGVLTNDVDNNPPNDLTSVQVSDPTSGTVTNFLSDGSFEYNPGLNFNGTDSFDYQAVESGNGATASAIVTIVVNPVNDAPVAIDDSITVEPDTASVLSLGLDLFANDNDVDGDSLSLDGFTQPSNGALVDNGDDTLTYTPTPGFVGVDSFTYSVTDGALPSNVATVTLSVSPINDAPRLVSGSTAFVKQVIGLNVDKTHAVIAADFDNDGDIDAAATDFQDDTVFWYENDGTNNFVERTLDAALDGAYPIHLADVDLDGDMDILAGGYLADTVAWYENDGSASFIKRIIDSTADGIHSMDTGDVDKDGDIDLVTTNQDAGTITWYENDGNNNFTNHLIDNSTTDAKDAVFVDIDGDGEIDIASASFTVDEVAWYENDGSENFTKHLIDTSANGAYSVSVGDMDGDTDIDVLSASRIDDTIAWYQNDGNGNFTNQVIDPNADAARTVIVSDLDSDGDNDAIAASVNDDTVAWHENDGSGIFTKRIIDSSDDGAYGLFATDMDNDGDIDVLSAARDANTVSIHQQIKAHEASLTQGGTLVIDQSLLLAVDVDDGPAELTYTVTTTPTSGTLWFNGVPLSVGSTFTQDDVNNNLVMYVHDGSTTASDTFDFTVADGGEDGVKPAAGTFSLTIL